VLRVVLAWLATGLLICGLSLACGPSASAPPTPSPDAFAVVRATAQAAYQAGQTAMASGDYLQACVDFDAAKTNDPDNRSDIQQALDQALSHCLTPAASPQVTAPPAAAPQRTLVVATIAAGLGTALAATTTPGTAQTPGASSTQTPPATVLAPPLPPTPAVAATSPPGPTAASANTPLNMWNDPQGRFSIGAPNGWTRVDQPQTLVGTGAVAFQDPSGRAELDVAVDSNTRAVSPELYAASLELAMQNQVPGYASEQVVPGTTAGSPSIRRVFTFTQRDATGQDHQARGFQLAVVKGSTPYLISGTAPAEQFDQFSPAFDQMVQSFRFS
jgi:hypothetical protein